MYRRISYTIAASILCVLLSAHSALSLEFEKEADKAQWIKKFFKNKKFGPIEYAKDATEAEKSFKRQLLKDFINQIGIEHVEPIAVGKSINDPEIAQFNTACPDKKPINIHRQWDPAGSKIAYQASEETLEDPNNEYTDVIIQRSCTGNLKVYRFNIYNRADNRQDYVLSCDDFKTDRFMGKITGKTKVRDKYNIEGAYLQFDPEKCLYSKEVSYTMFSQRKDSLDGVFKYKNKYYIYAIYTATISEDKERIKLNIVMIDGGLDKHKFYFYNTKERPK